MSGGIYQFRKKYFQGSHKLWVLLIWVVAGFSNFLKVGQNLAAGVWNMLIAKRAFLNPNVTVAILATVGLAALILQAARDRWYPSFAISEVIFLVFACGSVYAGFWISSRVPPRIDKVAQHLGLSSGSEGNSNLGTSIGRVQWLVLGILGILVSLAALYTHDRAGVPLFGFLRLFYFFSVFLNFWVVGVVLGLYFLTLIWLFQLSNQIPNLEPYEWRPEIVARVASAYLLATLFGVALYLVGLLAIWVSPGSSIFFAKGDLVRQLWILPLAFGVAGYFFLTQFLTHRIISNAKSSRLQHLRAKRDEAFKRWEREHRPDEAEVVEFLTRTIDDVSKEGTWPLNLPQLISVLVPIFAPASKELVRLFSVILGGDTS